VADLEEQSVKDQFVAELRRRGICNLSFVFREDFITIRTGVPWRTRMALSRLKKDIHMLPIFRDLGVEDLHRIKQEILIMILKGLDFCRENSCRPGASINLTSARKQLLISFFWSYVPK
jgi:hypothetical protein